MDSHPFVGRRTVNPPIRVRLKDNKHIRRFFDGTPNYEQVTNLTIGKVYEIYEVEGFGDVADAFVIGDNDKVEEIAIDWFEAVKE